MSDDGLRIFGSVPTGWQIPSAPDRPAGQFGVLRPATDELCAALRKRGVREIPEDKLVRHDGGRYWTDTENGEELELVRGFVDPVAPDEAGCVAFVSRGGYVVPLKRRGYQGEVKTGAFGTIGGGLATGKERAA